MTTVAITGLLIGFGLGVLVTLEAQKAKRALRRKLRKLTGRRTVARRSR